MMAKIEREKQLKAKIITLISVAVFLGIWELVARFELINPVFIGEPSQIVVEGIKLFVQGAIYEHLLSSLSAFFLAYFLAIVIGVLLGLLIGVSKNLYPIISPYIFAINSLPLVVILPLIIIWFGIGFQAKLVVIFLMALVPIFVSTVDSARAVDVSLLKMAKSFKAKKLFTLRTVTFFGSLPYIISGIRVALGRAVIGLVLAEFFGLGKGLGYLVSFYGATFQTNKLMAVIALILLFNYLLLAVIGFAEKTVVRWKL